MPRESIFSYSLKRAMERHVPIAITSEKFYGEAVSIACAFIGLLVARCTTPTGRDKTLNLISKHIAIYEAESRANIEDHVLMERHLTNGPPPNPISGQR